MATQTGRMPLIDIIRNAAGPEFKITEYNGVYRIVHNKFELAAIAEMDSHLLFWTDPALWNALPENTIKECTKAIERVKANYHFASCEPDGRGPYD